LAQPICLLIKQAVIPQPSKDQLNNVLFGMIGGTYKISWDELQAAAKNASAKAKDKANQNNQLVGLVTAVQAAVPAKVLMEPLKVVLAYAAMPLNGITNILKKDSNGGNALYNMVDKLSAKLTNTNF
jgi:hypothetical protein